LKRGKKKEKRILTHSAGPHRLKTKMDVHEREKGEGGRKKRGKTNPRIRKWRNHRSTSSHLRKRRGVAFVPLDFATSQARKRKRGGKGESSNAALRKGSSLTLVVEKEISIAAGLLGRGRKEKTGVSWRP